MRLPKVGRAPRLEPASPYGAPFWLAYVANTILMVALSLLFRFADFVTFLGGSELELGLIVGVGMVGSLAMRLVQGVGVDRYGARWVWLLSLGLFVGAVLAHLALATVHGPAVYALHILYRTAIAGAFGASITFVSLSVPITRLAEAVGSLGTSGFVGMIIGPLLGDWLVGANPSDRGTLDSMFYVAAGLGAISLVAAGLSTRGHPLPPPRRRRAPIWAVLRRYHPGIMLLMGIIAGMSISLPNIFLRPFAAALGIGQIAVFFTAYAMSAFTTRILTRRLVERWGVRPTLLLGMAAMTAGMIAFIPVRQAWHYVPPAILLGCAHALLFPAIMAGGSTGFPARYRGLATAVMLATQDLGLLLGAPLAGTIVALADRVGLPGYPTMFVTIAAVTTAAAACYYFSADCHDPRHPHGAIRPRRRARRHEVV